MVNYLYLGDLFRGGRGQSPYSSPGPQQQRQHRRAFHTLLKNLRTLFFFPTSEKDRKCPLIIVINCLTPASFSVIKCFWGNQYVTTICLRRLTIPLKTAHFEPQYLTRFKTNLNAISQVDNNDSPTTDFGIDMLSHFCVMNTLKNIA